MPCLNDTLAVVILRQLRFHFSRKRHWPRPSAADAAPTIANSRGGRIPQAIRFIRQKLPRRGGERQLIEQLLLRQAVGDYRTSRLTKAE